MTIRFINGINRATLITSLDDRRDRSMKNNPVKKNTNRNKPGKKLAIGLVILLLIAGWLYWGNNSIETTHHTYRHEAIPDSFDGYTIVQVSDLHNKEYNGRLTSEVQEQDPDLIVVTGDQVDRNRTNIEVAVKALEELVDIAPVYFVSGNHEIASGQYDTLSEELDNIGVINLDNETAVITENGEELGMIGIEDPLLMLLDDVEEAGSAELYLEGVINELIEEVNTDFVLLLSHRVELFDVYKETEVDLALTGHAHGGQIRLPFTDGLYAPSQGFFPEVTSGVTEENGTTMIASRGLGNSIFPFRINNRPELVVITLRSGG